MPDRFDYEVLSRELLRGGISPRRVRRVVRELRDHYRDLQTDALAKGMNPGEAQTWAVSRLGTEQDVASEMLARPELRSWAARWPWAVYALLPPVVLVGLTVLLVLAITGPVFELYTSQLDARGIKAPHSWFVGSVNYTLMAFQYATPLILCTTFCWMAVSRRTDSPWPILGIVVAGVLGGSFYMGMNWGEDQWSMTVSLFLYPPYPHPLESAIRIFANILLTLTPYLYWIRRQTGNPSDSV